MTEGCRIHPLTWSLSVAPSLLSPAPSEDGEAMLSELLPSNMSGPLMLRPYHPGVLQLLPSDPVRMVQSEVWVLSCPQSSVPGARNCQLLTVNSRSQGTSANLPHERVLGDEDLGTSAPMTHRDSPRSAGGLSHSCAQRPNEICSFCTSSPSRCSSPSLPHLEDFIPL